MTTTLTPRKHRKPKSDADWVRWFGMYALTFGIVLGFAAALLLTNAGWWIS